MGADSSDEQKQGTAAPKVSFRFPERQRDEETVADFTYESPEGWTANGTLGYAVGSGLYVQTITLDAGPGERITAKILRDLPLTDLMARAQRSDFIARAPLAEIAVRSPSTHPDQRKTGRPALSDDLLRAVALGYLSETEPGKGRGAVKRLAERLHTDQKTMSRYVWRARQAGWLGPAIQGREGGVPGRRLLEEWDAERVPGDQEAAKRFYEGLVDYTEAVFGLPKHPNNPEE